MIVRLCYAYYIQLLTQHNQEFQRYIRTRPSPMWSTGGSGNETNNLVCPWALTLV